jgi:murein DD-endopeptidase MepM/ murein hydrolase activator NlpD
MVSGARRDENSELRKLFSSVINFKLGKIATIVFFTFMFFMVLSIFIQMYSVPNEIVDLAQFTEYYEKSEEENGGIEVLEDVYYTFEKKYNFESDFKNSQEGLLANATGIEKKEMPQDIEYVIKRGDTIESIAKAHKISKEALIANNAVLNQKALKIGDKISILSENGVMYKIVKGDSLYKIASRYKINVNDILTYNDVNAKSLKIGQDIFLKDPDFKAFASNNTVVDKKKDVKDMKLPKGDRNITVARTGSKGENKGAAANAPSGGKETIVAGGFRYPVTYSGVSSPFGNRFHPVLRRYILHTGVDLIAKYVPLKAARSGKVSFAGYMGGYGKTIIVKHPDGYETRYAHLSSININVGSNVKAGELIGKTGMTGRVTGPHLHFEIRKDGQVKNPMKYLTQK